MNTLINNVVKVIAVPVGKKFATIAVMADGTEITLKAKGMYKPMVNFFNGNVNKNATNDLGMLTTFNTKIVTTNFWLHTGQSWVKAFDVELVA
tara:strand:+ start:171 stop:449 length:279 start_codon:yes stop_codon:yes gene_type:complete